MGHSWAAGLQSSWDGKNQESSSEAVNAYLAVAQLGKATGVVLAWSCAFHLVTRLYRALNTFLKTI